MAHTFNTAASGSALTQVTIKARTEGKGTVVPKLPM